MIRYQLQCPHDHRFECWFTNSQAFEEQAGAGRIDCPICGATDIQKAPMAPNISYRTRAKGKPRRSGRAANQIAQGADNDSGAKAAPSGKAEPAPSETAVPAPPERYAMQGEFMDLMRKVRKEVETRADYVGPRFAEEARKIHYEEVKPRGIYGEATPEEVEELNDEGVEFHPLPILPEDNN